MKLASILLITAIGISSSSFGQNEEEAVRKVVTSAYIQGIHNGGPIEDISSGFHPSFNMLRLVDNEVKPFSIQDWIKSIEKNRSESQGGQSVQTEGKFVNVAVSGTAASVVLELYRNNKKIFTDNLLLYKFDEGWRIVSKTYFRHP
jgi:hypothetical protein